MTDRDPAESLPIVASFCQVYEEKVSPSRSKKAS